MQTGVVISYFIKKTNHPLEAEPVAAIYRIAKSVAHSAMATYDLLAPYSANAATDLSWKSELQAYLIRIEIALKALDAANLQKNDRALIQFTLEQIKVFSDKCL
jgi:hypothetical protein